MKTIIPNVVLNQIDKAVNPNRVLGKVKSVPSTMFTFKDEYVAPENNLSNIQWRKRSYAFNRGPVAELTFNRFNAFEGYINKSYVTSNYGNFSDFLDGIWSNVQYGVSVYVDKETRINLELTISNACIALYVGSNLRISSGENYYLPGEISLILDKGWNDLYIFVYKQTQKSYFTLESDIGKNVISWKNVDFDPPLTPAWADNDPIITKVVDATRSSAIVNILRVKNGKFTDPSSNVRGYEFYRQETSTILDQTSEAAMAVVSGWGSNSFAVSNDEMSSFPVSGTLVIAGSDYVVSGSDYNEYMDQTIVNLYSANTGITSSAGIRSKKYVHVLTKELDGTEGYIVSGTDATPVNGVTYNYYFVAYDDSPNKNRSPRSEVKSILSGDNTAPGKASSVTAAGGIQSITLTWTPPFDLDVAGFKIWSKDNPNPAAGDKPIKVVPADRIAVSSEVAEAV